MLLGLTDVLRSGFPRVSSSPEPATNGIVDSHYIRGNVQDRGPCPGLNALANHGFLPRDGKNITIAEVEKALMKHLHMDRALVSSIARPLNQILHPDHTFDLIDMRRHNVIEHDASMTRLDARQGDNYTFQPAMLQAMLEDAEGGPVTVKTLATSYNRRQRERQADGGAPIPLNLWFVNIVQTVSFLNTAADTTSGGGGEAELSSDVLKLFYEEERISDVILDNHQTRTLSSLLWNAFKLMLYVAMGYYRWW